MDLKETVEVAVRAIKVDWGVTFLSVKSSFLVVNECAQSSYGLWIF